MRERSYNLGRVCPCGAPVSNKAKNGVCRPCFMAAFHADPARARKIGDTHRARLQDPANYAKHCEQARRAGETKRASPELRAKASRVMREIVQPLSMTPENLAKRDYALTGRLSGESKMAWCPPKYLAEYRYLTNVKKLRRAEAKAMIFAQAEADRKRNAPKPVELSPFERQERALARGARLVANVKATANRATGYELLDEAKAA